MATNKIITPSITDLAVTTAKIADGNVTTDKIDALAVTTTKIADGNVTTDKIDALAVTTDKIDALAVTTAKIADGNVTTDKIDDDSVTDLKLSSVKLDGIESYAQVNVDVQSDWNQTTTGSGDFIKNKPVVGDGGLTTKDFSLALKNKLDGIEATAEVNVQSDWSQATTTADDYINNKQNIQYTSAIPNATSSQTGLVTSTQITKLDGIESTAEVNVQSDWTSESGDSYINNKPTILTKPEADDNYLITKHFFSSDRYRDDDYDFMSSRNSGILQVATYPYNMNRAFSTGVCAATHTGSISTTYATNSWNYHYMYDIIRDHTNNIFGMSIQVPGDTDVIAVRMPAHDTWEMASLSKTVNGSFDSYPCNTNCTGGRRYMTMGAKAHSMGIGAFGEYNKEPYGIIGHFNIPRSANPQTFIMTSGTATNNYGAYISGLAFLENPYLYASEKGNGYAFATNGGNGVLDDNSDWAGANLVRINNNTTALLKVPVAPDIPGITPSNSSRTLFIIARAEQNIESHLHYVQINGNEYQLKADASGLSYELWMGSATADHFNVQTIDIDIGDIPATVLSNGGCIDVTCNNTNTSQDFYFIEAGTYLSGIQ